MQVSGYRRDHILSQFANYILVDDLTKSVENTFIVSAWNPQVAKFRVSQSKQGASAPMLVTYNLHADKQIDPKLVVGHVSNDFAHPQLSFANLALASAALPLMQGLENMYFCGSYATPGNGHDLSLLSGIAAANAACGGSLPFPFDCPNAKKDFERMKKLMKL